MNTDVPDESDSRTTRELIAVFGRACAGCAGACSARDTVRSIALGFKTAPRCLACLASGLRRSEAELRDQLADYVSRRECFRRAWVEAERLDTAPVPAFTASAPEPAMQVAAQEEWDAGAMACGELVLALRVRLNTLPPGALLRVRATDPAAPLDLPAWCNLTRHALVAADHPHYTIRRRED
jgi:tRNA 2-thiouridine synthesizing protein A